MYPVIEALFPHHGVKKSTPMGCRVAANGNGTVEQATVVVGM